MNAAPQANSALPGSAHLADIHLPPPVSWFPPAPGWWLLSILLLMVLIGAIWWWYQRRRQTAYLRQAQLELTRLHSESDDQRLSQQLNVLLRRVALTAAADPADVTTLHGSDWANYLHHHGDLPLDMAQELATLPYRPRGQLQDRSATLAAVQRWLRPSRRGRRV